MSKWIRRRGGLVVSRQAGVRRQRRVRRPRVAIDGGQRCGQPLSQDEVSGVRHARSVAARAGERRCAIDAGGIPGSGDRQRDDTRAGLAQGLARRGEPRGLRLRCWNCTSRRSASAGPATPGPSFTGWTCFRSGTDGVRRGCHLHPLRSRSRVPPCSAEMRPRHLPRGPRSARQSRWGN
jgi:hypothetical protein